MAKIETNAFDTADYLGTNEAKAAYLEVYRQNGSAEEQRAATATVARASSRKA